MKVFSEDTLRFLKEVYENNSREWFHENKDWYQEALITPLTNFVEYLRETMHGIDAEFELMPGINNILAQLSRQKSKIFIMN